MPRRSEIKLGYSFNIGAGRRITLDRRHREVLGILIAVFSGRMTGKRRGERRSGFDRRARSSPAYQ